MDLFTFCEFQQYKLPEHSEGFLPPCIELFVVSASHLLLAVIYIIQYSFNVHITIQTSITIPTFLQFAYCSAFCCVSCLLQMFIILLPQVSVTIPPVLLLSNSFASFVWMSIAFMFLRHRHSSSQPSLALLPLLFTTITFSLIFVQRIISFGIINPITIVSILPVIVQFLLLLLTLMKQFNDRQQFVRLEEQNIATENGLISDGITTPLVYQEQKGLIPFFFSELFFLWTNKLIKKGYKRKIKQVDDLFDLPNSLDLTSLGSVLSHPLETETATFTPILLRVYGRQFFMLGLLRFIGDIFKFASPIILHMLISSLQGKIEMTTSYICCALMFITMLFASLCDLHFGYRIILLSIKAKSALLLAIYEKLLRIPSYKISGEFSSGKLINLMCTDIDRIGGFIISFHAFWSMPMNFIIALYLIYKEMGLAFLAGIAASALLIPLNKLIASKIGKYSNEMMSIKDARLKLVSEISHSMRTIKLNSWENFFETKINSIRHRELTYLRYIKFLDAVCVYLWASAPILITMLMLGTSTLILHEQLTAAKVFTTLALINILILPLNAFPWVLGSIINGLVSKRRFDSFFAIQSTKDLKQFYLPMSDSTKLLELKKNSFGWENEKVAISNVEFKGEPGMLIGVIGPVGSGKSTLLLGILSEAIIQGPSILLNEDIISEGFAYVGQDVWLRNGSVRENILCELPFTSEHFRSTIDVCSLKMDIESMPGRDNYRIGGEGVTLSGGQKVRLALARAVYADKHIYLLDDPFAALDRTVASFIYENCIEKQLISRGKLVILCTHHERFLARADLIIQLNVEGNVLRVGSPEMILPNIVGDKKQIKQQVDKNSVEENDDLSQPMEAAEFIASIDDEPLEEKEEGTVKIRIYKTYFRAIVMQASKNASDAWLSKWTSTNNSDHNHSKSLLQQDWGYPFSTRFIIPLTYNEHDQAMFYLRIYIAIVGLNSLSTLIRAFLFAIACIYAAKCLHQRLLSRIFKASISWWDRTPCGRVTNRLSTDVSIVDDSLPFQLNICLASVFSLIGRKYYRRTNIELVRLTLTLFNLLYLQKRICAVTLSPLYSHLSETVSGLVTIRSLRISEFFSSKMRTRLGYNLRASFSSLAASQWLSVRIQMLGLCVLTVILFASILDVTIFKLSHPGLIGLAITYALSLTNVLNALLTSFIETEKELVSVERICDYVDNVLMEEDDQLLSLQSQIDNEDDSLILPIVGHIRFESVSLRYSPELPLAINDVSFRLEAGTRTAIIGRTGAGKSTILQVLNIILVNSLCNILFKALLRAHPIENGKILIDDRIDLASLGFKSARALFGYVSQRPFLFSGTLFDNLSISNTNLNNKQIEESIAERGLSQWLEQFGGLNKIISEGGKNLSFGERQLISLLRLSLTKPKIILIDEATAHMDEHTHLLMSRLISRMGCTVIAIVHRLTGLDEHYDWVIGMDI
uniref:ABC-type xenobiotic transporter n=1 Tax=Meloidogyne hapla TaxID=6305 RepID=A0A1I8B9I2_MELHA